MSSNQEDSFLENSDAANDCHNRFNARFQAEDEELLMEISNDENVLNEAFMEFEDSDTSSEPEEVDLTWQTPFIPYNKLRSSFSDPNLSQIGQYCYKIRNEFLSIESCIKQARSIGLSRRTLLEDAGFSLSSEEYSLQIHDGIYDLLNILRKLKKLSLQ
jgi:hypothetical protein